MKINTALKVALVSFCILVAGAATASLVVVYDGGTIDARLSNQERHYFLPGGLSPDNEIYSLRFYFGDGQNNLEEIIINAPQDNRMGMILSSGPEGAGSILAVSPSGLVMSAGSMWELNLDAFKDDYEEVYLTADNLQLSYTYSAMDLFDGSFFITELIDDTFLPEPTSIFYIVFAALGLMSLVNKNKDIATMKMMRAH